MFLTKDELIELTSYRATNSQITWLKEHGLKFLVAGDGKPRVLKNHLERILGAHEKPRTQDEVPNFDAIR